MLKDRLEASRFQPVFFVANIRDSFARPSPRFQGGAQECAAHPNAKALMPKNGTRQEHASSA
jgi:hypothetical protein